jgi:methyl-accepting chemotaxis protein
MTNRRSNAAHRGVTRLFTERKIGTKVAIGFGCVLAIMAVVSATSYLSFGRVAANVDTLARYNNVEGIARDIDHEFLALRRFVREYAMTGNESEVANVEKGVTSVKRAVDQGFKTIKSPERLAKLKEVQAQVDEYAKHFATLLKLRRGQIKTIAEILDPSGSKLRTDFEGLQAAAARSGNSNMLTLAWQGMEHVMLARLNVNKVLSRHDEAVAKAAEKAFADLAAVMSGLDAATKGSDARKSYDEIKALIDKYHEGYVGAAGDGRELDTLVNTTMKKLGEDTGVDAGAIKDSAVKDAGAIEKETKSFIASVETFVLMLAIGGMLLGILVAWLIGRGISRPITGMTGAMTALAGGDHAVEIPARDNVDEIGSMAKAVQVFKDNMIEAERLRAEQERQKQHTEAERRKMMMTLADDFEKAVGGIVQTVSSSSSQLEAAARTLTKTADTTQQLSTSVAAASEEASTNVQSVASATEELTASVGEIGRQVHESSRISNEAVSQAQKTDDRINKLSQAASRIGDVTKLITSIAEQTNLLALNATIEAARAGAAGKGFAVVAQEVKQLAAQTAKATSEISGQIAEMQAATQESVVAIKEIGGTIGRISEIASTIAAAVEEQGAATQEITRNVQQAAAGTTQVASNITDVNRGAAETGSASAQVLSSAGSLSTESNRLKQEMGKFLATVRAA